MKKKQPAKFAIVRKQLTLILLAAFLIVPSLSVVSWAQTLKKSDSRKLETVADFNSRAIDTSNKSLTLFHEPLVSVTFDDGYESTYTTAFPLLQKYGIHSTQYIISGELKNKDYMSAAQIKAVQDAGNDIACHTVTHPDLTGLDAKDLNDQLANCQKTLTKLFGAVPDFASPYGATNATTIKAISKYFRSQRNTNGDISNGINNADVNVAANYDPYNIIAVTIRRDTSVAQIKQLLDYAVANNAWVVLTYHQVDDGDSQFGLDPSVLESQLKVVSEYPIKIVTVGDVLNSQKVQTGGF